MTNTLQRALTPLFIIGSFCSLCPFEYPLGRPRPYLSCLYVLVIWSYHTYKINYPYFVNQWQSKEINFSSFKFWIPIPLILISLYRFKELKMCLHELFILDDTLEALGVPKEYQRLRNWIIQIIIGWIAYIFFYIIGYVYLHLLHSHSNFSVMIYLRAFVTYYPMYVIILSSLICGTVLGYTCSRFNQVNNHLHVLYSDLFENNVDYRRQNRSILVRQRITSAKDRKQSIWITMHVHLQLCLISRKLNKVFNIQMSLQMLWYFLQATVAYINIYVILTNDVTFWTFENTIHFLIVHSYFILYTILFLTINYVCQNVYYKISETVAMIHKLFNCNLDEDLRELILQFILQIKQREVKFGLGFFHFGHNFVGQLYSAVLACLIILIQMDLLGYMTG